MKEIVREWCRWVKWKWMDRWGGKIVAQEKSFVVFFFFSLSTGTRKQMKQRRKKEGKRRA